MTSEFRYWPISEVAAQGVKVRLVGRSGLDLLTLRSSHFDPQRSLRAVTHRNAALPGAQCARSSDIVGLVTVHERVE